MASLVSGLGNTPTDSFHMSLPKLTTDFSLSKIHQNANEFSLNTDESSGTRVSIPESTGSEEGTELASGWA